MPAAIPGRTEQVLVAVQQHWASHGYAPSVRDIVAATGIPSTEGVQRQLKLLREQGLIDFQPQTNRTTRLTDAGRAVVRELAGGGA